MNLMAIGDFRVRTYCLLEGDTSWSCRAVHYTIVGLIVISTIAIILETVQTIGTAARPLFNFLEVTAIAAFTAEYVFRIWSITESPAYAEPFRGRVRYALSPFALIDLIAILPFYLTFVPLDLRFLRLLRVLRMLRVTKLVRYSAALQTLGRVFLAKRYELGITFLLGGILLIIASSLMYFVETEAQPDLYTSIPATMWWSIATLTTVGYGDLYPVTCLGKILGSIIAVLGIGLFALPTGILGAAFMQEMDCAKSDKGGDYCANCGRPWTRD